MILYCLTSYLITKLQLSPEIICNLLQKVFDCVVNEINTCIEIVNPKNSEDINAVINVMFYFINKTI